MNRRRRLLLLTALAAPVAYLAAKRPGKNGGAHNDYFLGVQSALRHAGLFRPTLVIDRHQLAHNLGRLKSNLPKNKKYRIVAKSLPSMGLIREVRAAMDTRRLMVFHQPHLNYVSVEMPDTELLLGKPMPAGAAKRYFDDHKPNAFRPGAQIEWLVDTPQRLGEYRELAPSVLPKGERMRINLELDVGLHRGGFQKARDVAEAIRAMKDDPALTFAGFMGYEAHAAKMPEAFGGVRGALAKSMAFYADCVDAARETLGSEFAPETLTFNAGGSNTYEYYNESAPCNELAMGSGLVKPTDFDTAGLNDHVPACYIATPVLKALDHTDIPGLEALTGVFRAWDPNTARTFFIYGGYWHAEMVSPPGLQRNAIFGHSTNQEMLNGSTDVQLGVGDYVFYRPQQSEFVFLQFGDIAVFENGKITESWPVFPENARG